MVLCSCCPYPLPQVLRTMDSFVEDFKVQEAALCVLLQLSESAAGRGAIATDAAIPRVFTAMDTHVKNELVRGLCVLLGGACLCFAALPLCGPEYRCLRAAWTLVRVSRACLFAMCVVVCARRQVQEVAANLLSNMFAETDSAAVILDGDGVGRILRAMDECLESAVRTRRSCVQKPIRLVNSRCLQPHAPCMCRVDRSGSRERTSAPFRSHRSV